MTNLSIHLDTMPDIASHQRAPIASQLDWVGMEDIALPLQLADIDAGIVNCQSRARVFVNLARPEAKGIHMSRLFLTLEAFVAREPVTPESLDRLLRDELETHRDVSDRACVSLSFDYFARRKALVSGHEGWKSYPVTVTAGLAGNEPWVEVKLSIPYSSTCPCSASLSRQLIEQAFREDHPDAVQLDRAAVSRWLLSERASYATPHSQRSYAHIAVRLGGGDAFPLTQLIGRVEQALQTPVQTAVKRQDEQEFARLNGHNLMFCEDAARRIKKALEGAEGLEDFWLKVEHQESLHAHNAVAIATKGRQGGYAPELAF